MIKEKFLSLIEDQNNPISKRELIRNDDLVNVIKNQYQ